MSYSQNISCSSAGKSDLSLSSVILDKFKDVNFDETINRIDYKSTLVLFCAKCNTALGDSLGICGEYADLNSVICLSKYKLYNKSNVTLNILKKQPSEQ